MKKDVKHTINYILILALFAVSFFAHESTHTFSETKWYEGKRENIVCDVLENHVSVGTPLSEIEDCLKNGKNIGEDDKERYLSLFGYDGNEYDVILHTVNGAYNDTDGIENRYLVIIYDGEAVVKTMLIESLE